MNLTPWRALFTGKVFISTHLSLIRPMVIIAGGRLTHVHEAK